MGTTTLKEIFNAALVGELAAELRRAHSPFDAAAFVARSMDGLHHLELSARAWQIADALNAYLPRPFAKAAAVVEASLGPETPATGESGIAALRYMPHVFFVQRYGLDDYEAAIHLQAELTKRFSAEFSIRAFLVKYPERTYAQMLVWAHDESAHLRRLASEGTRPRLPWAPRLRAFQENPRPVLDLLEELKDDPVRYVQRSVANNLNDIAKDHPKIVVETCGRWAKGATAARTWVIGHALRSMVKAGNHEAIRILGGTERPGVKIGSIRMRPQRVRLGGVVHVSIDIESTAPTAQRLIVDYAVHFVKANGKTRPKVFKLRTLNLEARERTTLTSVVSFAEMTTRRHYPGTHRIEILVNGQPHAVGEFRLTR